MVEQQQQKRQIAYKVRIRDIILSKYVREEGWNPNYIVFRGVNISRVNIIATVIDKVIDENNYPSITIDDGTGKISARVFEKNGLLDNINIGDIVLIVGRPREYNGERYVLPEIVKIINDKRWIKVRELELGNVVEAKKEENIGNETVEEIDVNKEEIKSPAETAIDIIKKLDFGNGADFDEVLAQVKSEQVINELLKNGDIFEVAPGRLKVLE